MLRLSLSLLWLASTAATPSVAPTPYLPPPGDQVTSYFTTELPCKAGDRVSVSVPGSMKTKNGVECKGDLLEKKSLRELSIMRNTIYARYGWDQFRKPWLREYFHAQPWFRPDPKFSPKRLSDIDRKNANWIAKTEQSLTSSEIADRLAMVRAMRGKIFNDKPEWPYEGGKVIRSCSMPKDYPERDVDLSDESSRSYDCRAVALGAKPVENFSDEKLTPEDRIEIGLLGRLQGDFALDDGKAAASLDDLLSVEKLRQLSLRDLRLLRNTIYARRGRPFKSPILQDHFSRMSWYTINPAYQDDLLTKTDLRNIALVKSVEDEFGGSLTDTDWGAGPNAEASYVSGA